MGQINLFKPDEIEKPKGRKKSFSEEKNLFGLNPQTEEKVIRNDYKPKYFLSDTDDYVEALITNVKVTLLKAGLDRKAREFIDRVYKSHGNHHEIIRDYVIVIKPTPIEYKSQAEKDKAWKAKIRKQTKIAKTDKGRDFF